MVKRLAVVFLFDSATKHKETDNMMLHREADNIPVAGSLPDDVGVAVYPTENDNGG